MAARIKRYQAKSWRKLELFKSRNTQLFRELKWEVDEKRGSGQARACINLCLLILYCAANPAWAKEYVTLRI